MKLIFSMSLCIQKISNLYLQSGGFGIRVSNFFFGHFSQDLSQDFPRLRNVSKNKGPDVEFVFVLTGFFGIASKTTTPPNNLLCLETLVSRNFATSSPDTF